MRLPNADNAEIDTRKLKDYCLNPNHEVGKHKARVFAAALNLRIEDHAFLKEQLIKAVVENDAVSGVFNKYGQRYVVNFELEHDGRTAVVESVWLIDTGSEVPRLITCRVL